MRFLAIYSFSLLFLSAFCSPTCPSNGVAPCQCVEQDDYLEIECVSKDVTVNNLANVLSGLGKSDSIELKLQKMDLGSVPSNFFAGSNIIKLEIVNCDLTSLSEDGGKPFTGLEDTLKELVIYLSLSENIKVELNHLRSLTAVELSSNKIDELGNDWFPDSLTSLTLYNNGIQTLGDKAFDNLQNVKTLKLDGNRFGSISRSMLPNPATALEELDLNNNALTSVPDDILTNMPKLTVLSLNTNGLKRIEENIYKPILTQMHIIDFRGNPLECDSHIDWLLQSKTKAVVSGECNSPHDKKGVTLEDLMKSSS